MDNQTSTDRDRARDVGAAGGDGDRGIKDKATSAARTGAQAASEGARDVTDTAKQEARQVADEVSTQARRVAGDVGSQLRDQGHQQYGTMVSRLRSASDEMRQMTDGRDGSPATSLVSSLAQRTSRFADELEIKGPEGVLSEVQDFARRRPGTFLLAAVAAGFVAGRVGKSVFSAQQGGTSGDGAYRQAYEAGTYDTRTGLTGSGTSGLAGSGTGGLAGSGTSGTTAGTMAGASTTYTDTAAYTKPDDYIRDEGDFEDAQPSAVGSAGSRSGRPSSATRGGE